MTPPSLDASDAYRDLYDRQVVVDVRVPTVYIGRLIEANEHFVTLAEADVHELHESTVTKEVYVMESRRNGVQPNRRVVRIKQDEVLSLSALDDIILY